MSNVETLPVDDEKKSTTFPTLQPMFTVLPNGQMQMVLSIPPAGIQPHTQQPFYALPVQMSQYNQPYPHIPQQQQRYDQQSNQNYPPQYTPSVPKQDDFPAKPKTDKLALANLITYIFGLFTFVPHLASIILSFVMVHKGYFNRAHRIPIVLFTVMELIFWLFACSFAWFHTRHCYYNDSPYYYNYQRYYIYECSTTLWGLGAIIAWGLVALGFGAGRQVITWAAAKQYQREQYMEVEEDRAC